MKKGGKIKSLNSRGVLAMALLSMSVAFAMILSTIAWFTASNAVDNGVNEVVAVAQEIYGTKMKAYSVSEISGDSYTFVNNESYTLPRFDPSNIDYNEYEKALALRVEFSSSVADRFQIEVTCGETFHSDAEIMDQDDDHISNCVEFRAGTIASEIDPTAFTEGTINAITTTSFVSIQNGSVQKQMRISIIDIDAVVGLNITYVIMQYNDRVIEYINSLRNNNPSPITYYNDISFKIIGGSNA